jgi:hypothetical protein
MLRRLALGLAAGAVGTALMTALQEGVSRSRGSSGGEPPESWDDAPGPAQVANKAYRALSGGDLPLDAIPLATNGMHWAYGTAMGVPYALARRRSASGPLAAGVAYGLFVWASSYVQLVPLGIYEWPWHYSLKGLVPDVSYHLVYGSGVAAAYGALARE